MHIFLQNKFFKKFDFFRKGNTPQEYFFWGIECGDGWFDLLWKLCQDIEELGYCGQIIQIKEKFGGLRFYESYDNKNKEFSWNLPFKLYRFRICRLLENVIDFIRIKIFGYNTTYEKIMNLIDQAEDESYKICERCGSSGSIRGEGWLESLCLKCYFDDNKDMMNAI
jgi:hypothetical protein